MSQISRRTLLNRSVLVAAVGVGAAAGLTRTVHHKVAVPPPPAPAALVSALSRQTALASSYDAAIAAGTDADRLTSLRADVTAHVDALRGLLERYPGWRLSGSAAAAAAAAAANPTPAAPGAAALAASCRSSSAAALAACLAWPSSEPNAAEVVPVLGSMAASLATQAQVLAGTT